MHLQIFGYLLDADTLYYLTVLILITWNTRKPRNPSSVAF